jgi:hypothetical protein
MEKGKTLSRIAEKLDSLGISEEGIGELTTKDVNSFIDMELYFHLSLEPEVDFAMIEGLKGTNAFKQIKRRLEINNEYLVEFMTNLQYNSRVTF